MEEIVNENFIEAVRIHDFGVAVLGWKHASAAQAGEFEAIQDHFSV
jgi:hypothetical protein